MEQVSICIGEVDVPIIIDGGEEWFPVSFITTKVLLRSGKGSLVNKNNKDKINDYLQKYIVKFGDSNIQESTCISKNGLIELLKHTQVGRLSVEQRISQNKLHEYLGIELLNVEEQDSKNYNLEWLLEVDDYTQDIIKNELKSEKPEWIRMCSKCNFHYPLTSRFYHIDNRAEKSFGKVCKVCSGKQEYFIHHDDDVKKLKKYDLYGLIKDESLFKIYDAYKNKKLNRLPDCYENKESYAKIIKELFDRGNLNINNLTYNYLVKECRLSGISRYMDIVEIYKLLFGEDFYLYVWKYPKFSFRSIKLTYEIANQIIKNYIEENEIIINNIFTYDYDNLFKKCNLSNLTHNDILEFIVQYYNYEYAGYLYKTFAVNYYKKEENVIFDLKYLVEKDMKIEINKIPLYLTKYTLQKKSVSLYNYIVTNKNGSLYEWFNKAYPNQFTLHDFELNGYRNEFDSDKEMYIHELLNENFKNVIYNQKHTDRTLKLDDMIPDWFVMTENGVWIVEYFGLYEERQYGKSSRVTDYIDKTKRKIERYKDMKGYKFIFLYPKDTDDDFNGCRDIISKMKENPYVTML